MADEDTTGNEVIVLFLDVDGVLNENWFGHVEPSSFSEDNNGTLLDPQLLRNLGRLVYHLETDHSLSPRIVLSTTWRLRQNSRDELVASLAQTPVGECNNQNRNLKMYLNRWDYDDGDDAGATTAIAIAIAAKNDTRSWATPDLGNGTTPEGRVDEIQAWISDYCRRLLKIRKKKQKITTTRSELLFLTLDDLDLLYTDTGKRNEWMRPQNFCCTVSYDGRRLERGTAVGLTTPRVELALQKVRQQLETRTRKRIGTGDWTEEEWEILSKHPALQPHLRALRSEECPSWIVEIAQRHVALEQRNDDNRRVYFWCCPLRTV